MRLLQSKLGVIIQKTVFVVKHYLFMFDLTAYPAEPWWIVILKISHLKDFVRTLEEKIALAMFPSLSCFFVSFFSMETHFDEICEYKAYIFKLRSGWGSSQ